MSQNPHPEHPRSERPAAKTTEGTSAQQSPPAAAAPAAPIARAAAPKSRTAPAFETLPPFRVLLHNDAHNDMMFVVRSIVELTPLNAPLARDVMLTAHEAGVAQVLITHKERAELYQEQFASKGLVVTIEPAG